MPTVRTAEDIPVHYEDDFWGDPWTADSAETVMLVHGVSESSCAWYGWVPRLADRFRLIRPDLPGFGASPVAADQPYDWTVARLASDLVQLLDRLGIDRLHLVGAKYGGSIAARFAIDYADRLKSVSIVGGPIAMQNRSKGIDLAQYSADIERLGVRGWAAKSMRNRLGSGASDAHIAWWTDYMGSADHRATIACSRAAGALDMGEELAAVRVPSLFVTTRGSPLLPVDDYAATVARLPGARLTIIETDGYHPAATHPAEAADAVRTHILAHSG
jgi:3-oxoadipate enol-lactonase